MLLSLILAGLFAEELLLEPRVPVVLYVIICPSRQLRRYYRPPKTAACMVWSDHRFYCTHVLAYQIAANSTVKLIKEDTRPVRPILNLYLLPMLM